jgi:hypothetical protein
VIDQPAVTHHDTGGSGGAPNTRSKPAGAGAAEQSWVTTQVLAGIVALDAIFLAWCALNIWQ